MFRLIFAEKNAIVAGLTAFVIALSFPAGAELSQPSVEVSSPRNYGIVIGETLTSEIRVKVDADYQLDTAALPQPGSAVNDVLEVRKTDWDSQSTGNQTLYRITLTYQVFKGIREAETLTVPALTLRFSHLGQSVETLVPAWDYTLTPIIPSNTPDEAVVMRGDLPTPTYSSHQPLRWLGAWMAGLLGLGIYAAWNLGLPPFRRHAPPFVLAAHRLKKLGRQPATLGNYQQGAKLVHTALNETGGHTLLSSQLPVFLEKHQQFSLFKSDLERFFMLSDQIFYATDGKPPEDFPLATLEKLCWKLAKVKPA